MKQPRALEKEFLTINEVCDYLQISRVTLWRYTKRGLKIHKPNLSQPYFVKQEIEQWIRGI